MYNSKIFFCRMANGIGSVWITYCIHGHNLTIIWDINGDKYHLGKGLRVLVDGKEVGKADKLTKIVCEY